MATTNDKFEQQNAQTRELTDDELNQTSGGVPFSFPTYFSQDDQALYQFQHEINQNPH
jgi:bacteriocin-like protein